MRAVIQAVSSASVRVNGGEPRAIGSIHRKGRLCGLDKAGTVALFGIAVKGELADHQNLSPDGFQS